MDEKEFKFTDGNGGGCGTHSYRYATRGRRTVQVSHMPEEFTQVRVTIMSDGEMHIPILKLDEPDAKLLRIALNAMAIDLKWEDK